MLIMDAVELPLPTGTINPKAVLPNLSTRAVGPETRVSDGTDSSISVRARDPPSTSSRTDMKFSSPISNKKSCSEFLVPPKPGTSTSTSTSHTNSASRRYYNGETATGMILSLPKQDTKTAPKRSIKLINVLPPSHKRPKMEQIDTLPPVGTEMDDSSARISKHKRYNNEGKRTDRKIVRSIPKSGFPNYDSSTGGTTILGMYGLKIDLHDITKNMEELSLKDLLERSRGFQRHNSFNRENKGKKSTCSKEEFIISIRKSHFLLPVKELDPKSNKSCDKEITQNSSQLNPNEVSERLSLNQDQNLNSILNSPSLNASSLPPFHWSNSQCGGAHKSNCDSVRAPWVRIGGNFTSSSSSSSQSSSLLDYLEKLEKEFNVCDEKLKGLCTDLNSNRERGETHETASISGQTLDNSKQGQISPMVIEAAEILCEMLNSSNSHTTMTQKQTNGAIKWPPPNSPSLKTMKPSKPLPLPPLNRPENSSRNLDSPSRSFSKQSKPPAPPPVIDRKKHDNGSSKGSVKWAQRSEKGNVNNNNNNDKRPQNSSGGYSSQTRIERDYENQQRIRKATLTAASLGNNSGMSFGDWKRNKKG